VLVEKRSSRNALDGRTVMKNAQERKKKNNLEGLHGNSKSYNSFHALSKSEINRIVVETGISLGVDRMDRAASLHDIQQTDKDRAKKFDDEKPSGPLLGLIVMSH
jgi:hypothetical protein